jgi:hypothetical protein
LRETEALFLHEQVAVALALFGNVFKVEFARAVAFAPLKRFQDFWGGVLVQFDIGGGGIGSHFIDTFIHNYFLPWN